MKTRPRFFSALSHAGLVTSVLSGLLLTLSCDRSEEPATESIAEPAAPVPPPSPKVTLPPSGEITTSVATPSSPETRQLTPQEQNQVLGVMLDQLEDKQAKGLGSGKVTVNAAWHYDGYSYLSPNPAAELPARMVAVDVTVAGHTSDFDPDDIEIVDGITQVSYASDPHITFIKAPGELIENAREIPVAPAPIRMLLIYAFPRNSQKFTLYYWGQKLLKEPMTFEESGWGLPYPEPSNPAGN